MITLTDFITKYNGKEVDFDGYYGAQCVDLVQYWAQNLGGSPFWGDTYQIYSQAGTFYVQIPNPPVGGPKEGDIVVWAYTYNWAGGHVGIATGKGISTGAATDWFECFEQNDPTGSACQLKTYPFNSVMGWLRPKNYPPVTHLTDTQKIQAINSIIETQISDTQFRNSTREILKK